MTYCGFSYIGVFLTGAAIGIWLCGVIMLFINGGKKP